MSSAAGGCELEDVHLSYGATVALRGVDLTVAPGETVALVGPSGSGKTSLLRLLAGSLRPTAGTVRVGGHDLQELRDRRARARLVGMLHQAVDLVPQLSVKRNVQAGLLGRWGQMRSLTALMLPVEAPGARAAVERVGLGDRFGERADRLSGGEQQRIALARVLVQDPQVILADEPVAALDPARAADLLALLARLASEGGRTLVTSLHTPDQALAHLDRIVGLRRGQVVFDEQASAVAPADLAELYRLDAA